MKFRFLIFLQFSGVVENPYLTRNPKIRAQVWSGLDYQGFPVQVLKIFGLHYLESHFCDFEVGSPLVVYVTGMSHL